MLTVRSLRTDSRERCGSCLTASYVLWGLLLAHHVVRKLMLEAALAHEHPPDSLSFKHSLTLMRRKLPASGAIPPRAVPEVVAEVG